MKKTKKISNRTFYAMVAVIVLLIVMCAGTTLALFTDRLQSVGNDYTFGKIDIAWENNLPSFSVSRTVGNDTTTHLMPGDTITIDAPIVNLEEAAFVRKIVELEFQTLVCGKAEHTTHIEGCIICPEELGPGHEEHGEGCYSCEVHTHTDACYISIEERQKLVNSLTADEVHDWKAYKGAVAEELTETLKFRFVEIVAMNGGKSDASMNASEIEYNNNPIQSKTDAGVSVILPLELSNAWVSTQLKATLTVEAVQMANLIGVDIHGNVSTETNEFDWENVYAVYQPIDLTEEVKVEPVKEAASGEFTGEIQVTNAEIYFNILNSEPIEGNVTLNGLDDKAN